MQGLRGAVVVQRRLHLHLLVVEIGRRRVGAQGDFIDGLAT